MKSRLLKLGWLTAFLLTSTFSALALDGAMVITNPSVAADSLTAGALKDIYTAKTKYWGDGQAIIIVLLPVQTDAALHQASGMDASQFKTFWQRLTFSGRGSEPKKADDIAELVALVASTKGAIALVPAVVELAGVKQINIQ